MYTEFQQKIALAYAGAMFSDFLRNANAEEKEFENLSKTFSNYLEVGLGIALHFGE